MATPPTPQPDLAKELWEIKLKLAKLGKRWGSQHRHALQKLNGIEEQAAELEVLALETAQRLNELEKALTAPVRGQPAVAGSPVDSLRASRSA